MKRTDRPQSTDLTIEVNASSMITMSDASCVFIRRYLLDVSVYLALLLQCKVECLTELSQRGKRNYGQEDNRHVECIQQANVEIEDMKRGFLDNLKRADEDRQEKRETCAPLET